MGIQKDETNPDFDKIIGTRWVDKNSDNYASRSTQQLNKGVEAGVSAEANRQMNLTTATNMKGRTQESADASFTKTETNLNASQVRHNEDAVILGLMWQNIESTNGMLNVVSKGHQTAWENTKIQAVTNNWTQDELQQAKDQLDDAATQAADQIRNNFDATDDALKTQLKNGETPSVPSTMNTVPAGTEAADTPDSSALSPDVSSQMQSLMGLGTGLAQTGTGVLQSPPGADMIPTVAQEISKMINGGGGDVPVTPEMLDTLLAGQDSSGGDGPPSDGPPPHPDDAPPPREPEEKPEDASTLSSNSSTESGTQPLSNNIPTAAVPPSPAETPTSAAPSVPPSGQVPTTQLSGDNAAQNVSFSNTQADPTGTSLSGDATPVSNIAPSAPANTTPDLSQAAPVAQTDQSYATAPASADKTGTELSSSSAPAAVNPSHVGTNVSAAPVSGMGTGTPVMGGGGVGTAPFMGGGMGAAPVAGGIASPTMAQAAAVPNAPTAAAAPVAPAASTAVPPGQAPAQAPGPVAPLSQQNAHVATQQTAPPSAHPAQVPTRDPQAIPPVASAANAAGVLPLAAGTITAQEGSIYSTSSDYTPAHRRVAAVVNTLIHQYTHAGMSTEFAAAVFDNGVTVFTTIDGLGMLPRGAHIPVDVTPLSELEFVNGMFRADMTGCEYPGYVLRTAIDVGILPEPRAIVATDDGGDKGVLRITPEMLKGAPPMECPVSRADFEGIGADDVPLALEALKQAWDVTNTDNAFTNLLISRWERGGNPDSVRALAAYLIHEAEESIAQGNVADAGYALKQLLMIPEQAGRE